PRPARPPLCPYTTLFRSDQSAIDPSLGGLPLGTGGGISGEHWFGVEPGNGRDIFARIDYGARISMTIALSATLLTSALGVVFGLDRKSTRLNSSHVSISY